MFVSESWARGNESSSNSGEVGLGEWGSVGWASSCNLVQDFNEEAGSWFLYWLRMFSICVLMASVTSRGKPIVFCISEATD